MSERPSVDGVRAKLARAEQHLKALDASIDAYLAPPEPYRVRGEEYLEGNRYAQRAILEVIEFPPDEEWGPLIGDFVHNLRSALDHLAWEIALPQVKTSAPEKIGFPISSPDRTQATAGWIRNRLAMFPEASRAIIDRLQPYATGDSHHPLWVLQKLWNADKHRTITTAGFALIPDGPEPVSGNPLDLPGSWSHGRFKSRAQPLGYRSGLTHSGDLQDYVNVWAHSAKDVTLGQPGDLPSAEYPYDGLPIRRVLQRVQKVVVTEAVWPIREALA